MGYYTVNNHYISFINEQDTASPEIYLQEYILKKKKKYAYLKSLNSLFSHLFPIFVSASIFKVQNELKWKLKEGNELQQL